MINIVVCAYCEAIDIFKGEEYNKSTVPCFLPETRFLVGWSEPALLQVNILCYSKRKFTIVYIFKLLGVVVPKWVNIG